MKEFSIRIGLAITGQTCKGVTYGEMVNDHVRTYCANMDGTPLGAVSESQALNTLSLLVQGVYLTKEETENRRFYAKVNVPGFKGKVRFRFWVVEESPLSRS